MIKAVIDTNVFVSSFFGGNPKAVLDQWKQGALQWCLSPQILDEYFAVLKRLKLDDALVAEHLRLLSKQYNTFFVRHAPTLDLVKADPYDNMFFECAVATDAHYIISGDKHLLDVRKHLKIEVLKPKDFLEKI